MAIQPNGSFNSTTSQEGLLSGNKAKFTYAISGRFQAATATAGASGAGTWREDIAFASGQPVLCTSNAQSWSASVYREPPQRRTFAQSGSYSGSSGQSQGSFTFSVAPGGRSILNISDGATYLSCTPSGYEEDHLTIPQVDIQPNGSFNSTTSQNGVLNGHNAKFTYTIAGYFEGTNPPNGAATVAGIWREDIVFASGATAMCTSDDQFWTATRS